MGSFFTTAHKTDAGAPIGAAGFGSLARLAPAGVPVIAIGGIDRHNVSEVIAAGAHGVAVIGAIFAQDDIEQAARALRAAVDQALSGGARRAR